MEKCMEARGFVLFEEFLLELERQYTSSLLEFSSLYLQRIEWVDSVDKK